MTCQSHRALFDHLIDRLSAEYSVAIYMKKNRLAKRKIETRIDGSNSSLLRERYCLGNPFAGCAWSEFIICDHREHVR